VPGPTNADIKAMPARIRLRRNWLLRLRASSRWPASIVSPLWATIPCATRPGRLRRRSHDSGPFPCPGIAGSPFLHAARERRAGLTN